jgi:hypothetical protein
LPPERIHFKDEDSFAPSPAAKRLNFVKMLRGIPAMKNVAAMKIAVLLDVPVRSE